MLYILEELSREVSGRYMIVHLMGEINFAFQINEIRKWIKIKD